MSSRKINALNALCDSIQDTMIIDFISVGDAISDSMAEALESIVESSLCLQLKVKKDSDQSEPYIRIRDNIRLKVRPYEKLYDMFIDLLGSSLDPEPLVKHLNIQDILAPVFLKVYVAPFCPYCPKVVKEMTDLALASDLIHIDIIDGALFTQKAQDDQIMAAPTVICDDKRRWTGSVSAQEILDIILKRKPEDLSPHTLKAMIESGNAATLGQLMVRENTVFSSIYSLLTDDKWPVRLGAMVTVQTIHELKSELSVRIIHGLWECFDEFSDTVKGDVIFLTGEVAPDDFKEKLNTLLGDGLPEELREAVKDALENIVS